MTTLLERVTQNAGRLRVDRDAGVIYGVRVIGLTSANGRDYTPEAIRKALPLYEGCPVNINHALPGQANTVERRVGWLQGVKQESDGGARGDLHLLKSHPATAAILEAAERRPELFGLSHNAHGTSRRVNGREKIESIEKVVSVDVVVDPASVKSLAESRVDADAAPADPQALAAWLNDGARPRGVMSSRVLREDFGDAPMLPAGPDAADRSDEAIRNAFYSAWCKLFTAKLGDDEKLAKARALLKAVAEHVSAAASESRRAVAGNLTEGVAPDDPKALARWLNGK